METCTGFGWDRVNLLQSMYTGLCFGFVLETALMTQGFHYCWAGQSRPNKIKAFSAPHPTKEESGGAQGVGRGHSQDK